MHIVKMVFKYCYCIINNSIKYQAFVYTQLNDQTFLFDAIRCYHSRVQWAWEQWQWRGMLHSSKFQYYWNLIIRLFSVTSRTFVGEGVSYLSAEIQLVYSTAPADWAAEGLVNTDSVSFAMCCYKKLVFKKYQE